MKNIAKIIRLSIIPILIALSIFIGLNTASAENVDYEVNIAPALTVTVTSGGESTNNLVLNLNPMNHAFDSNSIDVTVATNNVTGYNLAMSTVNGSTDLVRNQDPSSTGTNDGVSAVLSTLVNNASSTGYSEAEFRNCNTSDCTNKWGFKVSSSDTDSSKVTSNYFPFAADANLAVNHYATNGDTTSLDFAAKIDWNQPAGTYENTLVFTATATYAAYDIKYYNGIDNAESQEIAVQTNDYNTSSNVKLEPGVTPTRSTYDFVKWCDTIPGADSNNYFPATTCSGNTYNTGDTITINPEDYNTNIKLYAYWDPTTFEEAYEKIAQSTGDASITTKVTGKTSTNQDITAYQMQKMSKDICAATTINEVTQLVDSRSGNYAYYVAKLKDDKCWMTQNLRLGTNLATTTGTLRLYSSDSNISGVYWDLSNKVVNGEMPIRSITDDTTGKPAYIYDGDAFYCTPDGSNNYVGCYYNWYTATAGTGTSEVTGKDTEYVDGRPIGKDVDASICPKGWVLPKGGPLGDFQALYNQYPSADEMLTPNKTIDRDNTTGLPRPGFLLDGNYSQNKQGWVGVYGFYWSRTAFTSGYGYQMSMVESAVYYLDSDNKLIGKTIRCIVYSS